MRISTDKTELDIPLIHRFLSGESYWARGIPLETLQRAIDNSLCFAGFVDGRQVAFARVVSDFATFAYLGDVFVLPEVRGKGHARALMEAIDAHPKLQGLRRFQLVTSDAHGLYERFGFTPLAHPARHMERHRPDVYKTSAP